MKPLANCYPITYDLLTLEPVCPMETIIRLRYVRELRSIGKGYRQFKFRADSLNDSTHNAFVS